MMLPYVQTCYERLGVGCGLVCYHVRDGEVPSQEELSSYFEELFSSKVPCQKELSSSNEELSSSNEELFPNTDLHLIVQKSSRLPLLGNDRTYF